MMIVVPYLKQRHKKAFGDNVVELLSVLWKKMDLKATSLFHMQTLIFHKINKKWLKKLVLMFEIKVIN